MGAQKKKRIIKEFVIIDIKVVKTYFGTLLSTFCTSIRRNDAQTSPALGLLLLLVLLVLASGGAGTGSGAGARSGIAGVSDGTAGRRRGLMFLTSAGPGGGRGPRRLLG